MKNKFTFKTERPTGSYSSFFPSTHHIKFKKFNVGVIEDKLPHRVRLHVVKNDTLTDKNPNCNWMWITLAKESESVEDTKEWVNSVIDSLMRKYTLFGMKDNGEECVIENGVVKTKSE